MVPQKLWSHGDLWKETLFAARFASPTSAGVLCAMLAAAEWASTWVFRQARVLAIFDDLDTLLLMIPLKILMVGPRGQLPAVIAVICALLWVALRYLHRLRLPVTWHGVVLYAAVISGAGEVIYLGSKFIDDAVHVRLITVVSNFGEMFPAFCHRREASRRERLALAISMFPQGEVRAGVLVVSLAYGLQGRR